VSMGFLGDGALDCEWNDLVLYGVHFGCRNWRGSLKVWLEDSGVNCMSAPPRA
jgi:hypothetical protein